MQRRLCVILALSLLAADDKSSNWKSFLTREQSKTLLDRATARIDEQLKLLESGKLDEDDQARALSRARGATLLMAATVQCEKPSDASKVRAGLRDRLLELDRAFRDGKIKEGRAQFQSLSTSAKEGDPAPRDLCNVKESEDVAKILMNHFRIRAAGGLGIEPKPKEREHDGLEAYFRLLAMRPGDAPPLKPEELAILGREMAVLAELTRSLAPEKSVGDKTPEKWRQWSDQMRDASLELVQAAVDRKADDIRAAARQINGTCVRCHRAFRSS
jgi:cytochrome c556